MTPHYDLIADILIYAFEAWIAYVFFTMSQLLRMQYIERMAYPTARLITKFFEYLALFISGTLLVSISDYHGTIYYVGDLLLLGFFVRQFVKSDQLQRSEYLRHYNNSKSKLMTRMIMNLIHYPMHHDN